MLKFLTATSLSLMLTFGAQIPAIAKPLIGSSILGHLQGNALWADYKAEFLSEEGRIIDTANNNISHSEGQGYGMLLALAAADQEAFETIYDFSKRVLQVRGDNLFAWKYEPAGNGSTPDKNNATDGDILIAWALAEAAEAGWGEHYRADALAILNDVRKLLVQNDNIGLLMKPGSKGFLDEKKELIVNPSYWVFPAFERFSQLFGDNQWKRLSSSGHYLISQLNASAKKGVPDWAVVSANSANARLHDKKSSVFGYEAIRIPLYLMMQSNNKKRMAHSLLKELRDPDTQAILQFDTRDNKIKGRFDSRGYLSIASLSSCLENGQQFPVDQKDNLDTLYYPATLQLFSIMVASREAKQCL